MHVPKADRLLAVIGYLPFLFWLPVVARRQSMFCQFHGRQSGVLWGMWLTPVLLLLAVFWFLQDMLLDVAVWVFGTIAVLTGIYLLFVGIGMIKAAFRERYRMPVVADVALLLRL